MWTIVSLLVKHTPLARRRSLRSFLRSSPRQKMRIRYPTNSSVWSVMSCWVTLWSYRAVETASVTTVSLGHTHKHIQITYVHLKMWFFSWCTVSILEVQEATCVRLWLIKLKNQLNHISALGLNNKKSSVWYLHFSCSLLRYSHCLAGFRSTHLPDL